MSHENGEEFRRPIALDDTARNLADRVLRCPICSEPFTSDRMALVCARGHAFDRAREGYVHLLRSKRTGDSTEMLLARRSFLAAGYYQPLADLLCRLVVAYAPRQPITGDHVRYLLDAGCGEGYYLAAVAHALARGMPSTRAAAQAGSTPRWVFLALDASKEAVHLAIRRVPGATGVVADLQEDLPIASRSLHVLLDIFAPRRSAEFARILAPGGLLMIVIPAPDHLRELRATLGLLSMEAHKEQRLQALLESDFALVERAPRAYRIQPRAAHLQALLDMTPNYRHPGRRTGSVEEAACRPVQCSFIVLAYRRR